MSECAAVILAGGKSSRMGVDKSALQFQDQTLLGFMQSLIAENGLDDIYISHPDHIADKVAGCGPLAGVHATLEHIGGVHGNILYVPVDMPGLHEGVLSRLIRAPNEKALVYFQSFNMPFRLSTRELVRERLDSILRDKSNLSMGYFFDHIPDKHILESAGNKTAFININNQADWQAFLEAQDS